MSPMLAKRPCRRNGCSELVERGTPFCPAHQKAEHKQYNRDRPSARKQGYDGTYERLRRMKLRRNPICERCGEQAARITHHIKPVKTHPELRLVMSNLLSVCPTCHNLLEDRFRTALTVDRGINKDGAPVGETAIEKGYQ
ncbi:MAG: HNH endonuclease [Pseudomonadota bacterium]